MSDNSVIYMPIGLPGCGKSTLCKNIFSPYDTVRLSADDIRQELVPGVAYDPTLNQEVFRVYRERLIMYLEAKWSVYIDNTNVIFRSRKEYYDIASEYNINIHVILFKNIAEAIQRNKARTGEVSGIMGVPDDAMYRMQENLIKTFDTIDSEPWDTLTVIESFKIKSVA